MYRKYYGLRADPFRLSPDHAFCLPHQSFAKAKAYMRYALFQGEGFVMITGAPGTGKTTLIDDLLAGIRGSHFSIARLVNAQVEADDILRMVAHEFGLTIQQTEKSEILRLLSNQFSTNFKQGRRSLLVVDEAQGLGLSALEELRLLTNLHISGQPILQIFLVGQEELRDMVTSPKLEQLNQRMIAAHHMEPLKPKEFVAYVLHRLTVAGWEGNPRFEPDLFPELFRFSNGLPRRINHICSRLLLHGFLEEKTQLDAADIEIVIKELCTEHYTLKENTAYINQDKFNSEDLLRIAQTAISDQSKAKCATESMKEPKWTIANTHSEELAVSMPKYAVKPVSPTVTARPEIWVSKATEATPEAAQHEAAPATGSPAQRQATRPERPQPIDSGHQISSSERNTGRSLSRIRSRAWGVAATLVVGLSLVLLISLPSQHLNMVASQSVWNDIGLTKVRTWVANQSGGHLPLSKLAVPKSWESG